jgi:hypothetical protein
MGKGRVDRQRRSARVVSAYPAPSGTVSSNASVGTTLRQTPLRQRALNNGPNRLAERATRVWSSITALLPLVSGRVLAPLPLFLGVTFLYSGIQKLTDPQFFNPLASGYIGRQILAFAHCSPISRLLLSSSLIICSCRRWGQMWDQEQPGALICFGRSQG